MMRENIVADLAQAQDLLRLDLDIGRLSLCTAERLMDHDACVRQCVAFPRRACRQQNGAHARRLPDADGRDIRLDVLHRVVDGKPRRHDTARTVDVEVDVLVRILGLEKEQLCHNDIRHTVVNRST